MLPFDRVTLDLLTMMGYTCCVVTYSTFDDDSLSLWVKLKAFRTEVEADIYSWANYDPESYIMLLDDEAAELAKGVDGVIALVET